MIRVDWNRWRLKIQFIRSIEQRGQITRDNTGRISPWIYANYKTDAESFSAMDCWYCTIQVARLPPTCESSCKNAQQTSVSFFPRNTYFVILSLSVRLCLEVCRYSTDARHSFSRERLQSLSGTCLHRFDEIAIADEWPNFVRNPRPSLRIPNSDSTWENKVGCWVEGLWIPLKIFGTRNFRKLITGCHSRRAKIVNFHFIWEGYNFRWYDNFVLATQSLFVEVPNTRRAKHLPFSNFPQHSKLLI